MQAHTDASLRRFLRAFVDVDVAFKQLLKCNKWRREFKVTSLSPDDPDVAEEMATGKVHILRCRDNKGRSVLLGAVGVANSFVVGLIIKSSWPKLQCQKLQCHGSTLGQQSPL